MIENKLRLCLRELPLCLIERGLVGPRINREKQVALLHVSAVLKVTRHDLPAHLRLHLNGFVGAAGADFIEIQGHIFGDDFRHQHRSRRRLRRFSRIGSLAKRSKQNESGQHNKE